MTYSAKNNAVCGSAPGFAQVCYLFGNAYEGSVLTEYKFFHQCMCRDQNIESDPTISGMTRTSCSLVWGVTLKISDGNM